MLGGGEKVGREGVGTKERKEKGEDRGDGDGGAVDILKSRKISSSHL